MQATSQLDLVKAKEPERTQLREKVQFLNSLSPVHALYQQYIDKHSSLATLAQALTESDKSVHTAIQHESNCIEAYEALDLKLKRYNLRGLRWLNSDNSPKSLMS